MLQRRGAHWTDDEVPARSSAARRRGCGHRRGDIHLPLEPLQRRIELSDGDFPSCPSFDFLPDGDAVGVVSKLDDCEQYGLFKFA